MNHVQDCVSYRLNDDQPGDNGSSETLNVLDSLRDDEDKGAKDNNIDIRLYQTMDEECVTNHIAASMSRSETPANEHPPDFQLGENVQRLTFATPVLRQLHIALPYPDV